MATKKSQRIGIWIIVFLMAGGTIGSFAAIVLANQNSASDQAKLTSLTAEYKKAQDAYQVKVDAQAKELSAKYFDTFNKYMANIAAFDKGAVNELQKNDLVIGDGVDATAESSFSVYYVGWNPDGKMFDSSLNEDKSSLGKPLDHVSGVWTFPNGQTGGVIEGWTKGIEGMKVNGIRELTIPSAQAYGEKGGGELIPANTPLKFILMIIPTPEKIAQPEMPAELLNYYTTGRL